MKKNLNKYSGSASIAETVLFSLQQDGRCSSWSVQPSTEMSFMAKTKRSCIVQTKCRRKQLPRLWRNLFV